MVPEKLIIVGTSASAKQVYDFNRIHKLYDLVGFAVDIQYIKEDTYMDLPVYPLERLKEYFDQKEIKIFVSLGWNRLNADRRDLYLRLKKEGYRFANLISPTAIIRGSIDGDNIWINDYAVMQSDSLVKSNVTIREMVLIGNDTVIEEHCFIGVKSLVAGGCKIGKQSFTGINSTIFDGVTIGDKCIIGGGAIVKRNVDSYTVCKTNLSDTIVKNYDDHVIENKLLFSANVR